MDKIIIKSNKEVIWMRLYYNEETKRYGIINNMDLWENNGLHCGQCLRIKINNEWIADRLEMTPKGEWYLVNTKLKDHELEGLEIKI